MLIYNGPPHNDGLQHIEIIDRFVEHQEFGGVMLPVHGVHTGCGELSGDRLELSVIAWQVRCFWGMAMAGHHI